MMPNHPDADHRSFYGNEDGKIHADEEKPADERVSRDQQSVSRERIAINGVSINRISNSEQT